MVGQGQSDLEGDNVMSINPGDGGGYIPAKPFPVIAGAALLVGVGIAALAQIDKRAATILSLTLIAGIVLNRRVAQQFNDLVTVINGGR